MNIISKWLTIEFKNEKTRSTYRAGITRFANIVGDIKKKQDKRIRKSRKDRPTIKEIRAEQRIHKKRVSQWMENYLAQNPDFIGDIKFFISTLRNQDTPDKTVNTYVAAIKLFMEDHGYSIKEKIWKKIKKRLLPPQTEWTQDVAPTVDELKQVLNHLGIVGRSMVLFLASTGCRIGETLKLEVDDLDLDNDPPIVHIRSKITKKGKSGRTIPFSYEARDAIQSWLQVRDSLYKKNRESFSGERIWNISYPTVYELWNRALDKVGLVEKDKITGRKKIHIHSLRKWFRSNAKLDVDLKNAIMGHVRYLDKSYLRTDLNRVKQEYLEAMDSVSIYSKSATPSKIAQYKQMTKRLGITQHEIDELIADQFFKQEVEVEGEVTEPSEGGMDLTELAEVLFPDIFEEVLRTLITRKKEKEPNNQKVIDQSKLENHLSHGWSFVASIENNKCIVKQN